MLKDSLYKLGRLLIIIATFGLVLKAWSKNIEKEAIKTKELKETEEALNDAIKAKEIESNVEKMDDDHLDSIISGSMFDNKD